MTPAQYHALTLMIRFGIPSAVITRVPPAPGRDPKVRRVVAYCRARERLAYMLRHEHPPGQPFSYPEIAEALGWRSHSTAMEATQREQARRGAAKAIGVAESSATFQNTPTSQTGSTAARGQA